MFHVVGRSEIIPATADRHAGIRGADRRVCAVQTRLACQARVQGHALSLTKRRLDICARTTAVEHQPPKDAWVASYKVSELID